MATLSAQTEAPAKPTTEKKPAKAEEVKAETPVEKQAFKMVDLVTNSLPEILGSIKDEASLTAADAKLDELIKQIDEEEKALLKLEVPDNAARVALSKKLESKEKAMMEKMMPVVAGLQTLDPAVAMKLGPMMQKFEARMSKSTVADKYFKTDEELKNEAK